MGGSIRSRFVGALNSILCVPSLSALYASFSILKYFHEERERNREKITMAVPQKWVCVFSAVIVLLFVGVMATSRSDVGISAITRYTYKRAKCIYLRMCVSLLSRRWISSSTSRSLCLLCLRFGLAETELSLICIFNFSAFPTSAKK